MRACGPIPLRLHAVNDAVGLAFLRASPWPLGAFNGYADPTRDTVARVPIGTSLNLVTDYPLGVVEKPFRWRELVERTSPPPFIVLPWMFFVEAVTMPWVVSAFGALVIINALLTQATA